MWRSWTFQPMKSQSLDLARKLRKTHDRTMSGGDTADIGILYILMTDALCDAPENTFLFPHIFRIYA